jgi:3-hydroxyacyl-CoA dehydrogenase
MEKAVGVIGLGAMGLPIAIRLARAGFRLVAIDVDWWPAPRARGRPRAARAPSCGRAGWPRLGKSAEGKLTIISARCG